jgi:hypothetical protein
MYQTLGCRCVLPLCLLVWRAPEVEQVRPHDHENKRGVLDQLLLFGLTVAWAPLVACTTELLIDCQGTGAGAAQAQSNNKTTAENNATTDFTRWQPVAVRSWQAIGTGIESLLYHSKQHTGQAFLKVPSLPYLIICLHEVRISLIVC